MSSRPRRRRMLVMRLYLVAHRLQRGGPILRVLARGVSRVNKVLTSSDIDPRASIDPSVHMPHAIGVVIGERAVVGAGSTILSGVVLGAASWESDDRHPTIGCDVLVGAGAKVLGPVYVGDGAKIGANAVVLNDVPAGMTVVGIPAKPVGTLR